MSGRQPGAANRRVVRDVLRGAALGFGFFLASAGSVAAATGDPLPSDPFVLDSWLTQQAIFSCQDLKLEGDAVVGPLGDVEAFEAPETGEVVGNQKVEIANRAQVHGNVWSGPGYPVVVGNDAVVRGTTGQLPAPRDCMPVDVVQLRTLLISNNNNVSVPLTAAGRDPLSWRVGSGHDPSDPPVLELKGDDRLTLPSGTYFFKDLIVRERAELSLSGTARILVTNHFKAEGTARLNATGEPFALRVWSSGSEVRIKGDSIVRGFFYAPLAGTAEIRDRAQLQGSLFALKARMAETSFLNRQLDLPADPFAIRGWLSGQAVFSCRELAVKDDARVQSQGATSGGSQSLQGHVRSNNKVTLSNRARIQGDAIAGPGYIVDIRDQATVTGTVRTADTPHYCRPLDLALLYDALWVTNNNASVPFTSLAKDPLQWRPGDGATHSEPPNFEFDKGTLTLPAGTYLFRDFKVRGTAVLAVTGTVRILVTGHIELKDDGQINAGGSPWSLRLWSKSNDVKIQGRAVASGFVFAPFADPFEVSDDVQFSGTLFGKKIVVRRNALVNRPLDQSPPVLTVSSPAAGAELLVCQATVAGVASDSGGGVTVSVNGQAVEVGSNGAFSIDIALSGATPIAVIATDDDGNQTRVDVPITIRAPQVALVSPVSGSLVGARWVDLAGTSGTASVVTVNGLPALVNGSSWTLSAFDLGTDGAKTLTIVGTNCGGSATTVASLDLDTLPPQLAITSPINGSVVTSLTPSVTGTVSDAHLLSVVVNGLPATISGTSWQVNAVPLANGSSAIEAVASDQLGRTTTVRITVQIDTAAPVVSIDAPAPTDGDCLAGGQSFLVSGRFSDPNPATGLNGQPPALRLQLRKSDGTSADYVGTLSADSRSWSVSGVPFGAVDGTAVATAIGTDAVGNETRVARTWRVDAGTPTVELRLDGAPMPGAAAGTAPPPGAEPTLFGRAIAPRASVNDGAAGTPPSPTLVLDGAAYVAGTPITTEGNHLLVATVTDCADHSASAHAAFRIDLTAPTLVSTTPADGAELAAGPTSYTGAASEPLAAVRMAGQAATVTGASFSLSPAPWSEGPNTLAIELEDLAGNRATFDRTFSVLSIAPTIEIVEGGLPIVGGTTYTRAVTPRVHTNVSGTPVVSGFTPGVALATTGEYTLTATIADSLGRSATDSVAFFIDLEAGPAIAITSPTDGATLASPVVTVTGTVAGNTPSVTVNGVTATVANGSFSAALTLEADASVDLLAIARDAAGRSATDAITVLVRSAGPRVLILEPAPGTWTNRERIDVVGAVVGGRGQTADGSVTVTSSGVPMTVALETDGSFRARDVDLAEGSNSVGVAATDAFGRTTQETLVVLSDRTPPVVSITRDGQAFAEGASFPGEITLTVSVSDAGEALSPDVRLNGVLQSVSGNSVSIAVTATGGYVVSVVARDRAGNETRIERSFLIALGGCGLQNLEPADGVITAASAVSVRGKSAGAKSIVIKVGTEPYPVQIADGTFVAGDVPLAVGANRITIVCDDGSGPSNTDLDVERLPAEGPTVAITTPSAGSWLVADSATVSGTATPAEVSVTVNGLAAAVTTQAPGASFSQSSVPLVEGPNVLVARATDRVGRRSADRRIVWRDSRGPKIQITSPTNGNVVGPDSQGAATLPVSGVIDLSTEPNLATVTVASSAGSVSATVDAATGVFSASAPLALTASEQTVTVTAIDSLGNIGSASVRIAFDAAGPRLELTAPLDQARFSETATSLTVSGTAWAHEGAQVSVNGSTLAPEAVHWESAAEGARRAGTFTATLGLPSQDGGVGVIVRVTELEGGVAEARRLVYRDSSAPKVLETSPAEGATGVDANGLLLVLFDEIIAKSSLQVTGGLSLERVSTHESVVGQIAIAGTAVAFVPGSSLAAGESYVLHIGAAITDRVGHPLNAATAVHFVVASDTSAAAPSLDDFPAAVCPTVGLLAVRGFAVPQSSVRLGVGELVLQAFADASGRFEFSVPMADDGYYVLHVWTVERDGSAKSAEATRVVRVDCTGPRVISAALDRTAGVIEVRLSEAVSVASATSGGPGSSFRLFDADSGAEHGGTPSVNGSVVSLLLDTSAQAWWRDRSVRLVVSAPLADSQGHPLGASYETVFFPGGSGGDLEGSFLAGEAYDSSSGRPLEGASVRLFASGAQLPGVGAASSDPIATATTDGRGRYTFTGDVAAGRYVVLIEKAGFARAVRRLALEPGRGAVPFDARLEPLATPPFSLDPAAGGRAGAQASLALVAASGWLAGSDSVSVTLSTLDGQSLPELLPLGWTPLAAADLRLGQSGGVLPATAAFAGAVALELPLPNDIGVTTDLLAAAYDLAGGVWRNLGPPQFRTDSGATIAIVAISSPTPIAIVRPDPNGPAIPEIGQPLAGMALPAPLPALLGTLALDPPIVTPTGRARARVVARSEDLTSPWPSGLAVQAYVEEKLVLSGGGELYEAPFRTDLVLYRSPLTSGELDGALPAAAGALELWISPSPRAAQVLLETGFETIRLFPFPESLEREQVLGPAGGSVQSPDGVELSLPEGALTEKTVVGARRLSAAELSALSPVAGYDILTAIEVSLSGRELNRAATLSLPTPASAPTPSESRVILARREDAPADGRGAYASLISRTRQEGTSGAQRLVAAPEVATSSLPLVGLTREGLYLVLAAQQPLGFATGFVRAGSGVGLAGARSRTSGLGTADLSRVGGRYAIPLSAGSAREVEALHPTLDERGRATIATLAAGEVVAIDVTVQPVGPEVVAYAPESNAANGDLAHPVGSLVTAQLSEALDASSVSSTTLRLELLDDSGLGTGAFVPGSVALAGATIVFTPTRPLAPGRRFRAQFNGGVRDAGGTWYSGAVPITWSFRTSTQVIATGGVDPSKFHVGIPESGAARVWGESDAVPRQPSGWLILAEIEGPIADSQLSQTTAGTNGSFSLSVGHPPAHTVTLSSRIWVKVFDPAGELAAHFRLGPFVSEDRLSFVAPAGEEVAFTSAEGIGVTVPEGAFDVPTVVRVEMRETSAIGVVPSQGIRFGAFVDLDFDGTANETLRLSVPAPAGSQEGERVFMGVPTDLPWGRRIELRSLGTVGPGTSGLVMRNDESEPAAGSRAWRPREATATSCVSTSVSHELLQEFLRASTVVFGIASAAEIGVLVGAAPNLGQNQVIYGSLTDSYVYRAGDRGGLGCYAIPVRADANFRVVRRDTATGWILAEDVYSVTGNLTDPWIDVGSMSDVATTKPHLVDGGPFVLQRLVVPADGLLPIRSNLYLEAQDSILRLRTVGSGGIPNGTRVELFNVTKGHSDSDTVTNGVLPDSIEVLGFRNDELAIVLSPPAVDTSEPIRLSWNRRVELRDVDGQPAIRLTDVTTGETIPLQALPTKPSIDFELVPRANLAREHRYRIDIRATGVVASGTNPEVVYSAAEPQELFFSTRTEPETIGEMSDADGWPALGDTADARDMIAFGNVLLVGSATGRLWAVDVTDPRRPRRFAVMNESTEGLRAFAKDTHGRAFFAARHGSLWRVQAVRIEDVFAAKPENCVWAGSPPTWAEGIGCFDRAPGDVRVATVPGGDLSASEFLTLASALPDATPTDLEVVVDDLISSDQELEEFYEHNRVGSDPLADPDGDGVYRFSIRLMPVPPDPTDDGCPSSDQYAYQRATVENLTSGENRFVDLSLGGSLGTVVENLRARRGDLLHIRYNLRTFGYAALLGHGISVLDLARTYKGWSDIGLPFSQCGRRLGSYTGTDLVQRPGCGPTIALTPAVAPIAPATGGTAIQVYSPLLHCGVVNSTSSLDAPGDLSGVESRFLYEPDVRQRFQDVVAVSDVEWTDFGQRQSVDPPKPGEARRGDLLFVAAGNGGVLAFDVASRQLEPIGNFRIPGHPVFRLEVDAVRGLLLAGGPLGIDVFDLARANGWPNEKGDSRLLYSLDVPWSTGHIGLLANGTLLSWGSWTASGQAETGARVVQLDDPRLAFSGLYRDEAVLVGRLSDALLPLGVAAEVDAAAEDTNQAQNEARYASSFRVRLWLPGGYGGDAGVITAKLESLLEAPSALAVGDGARAAGGGPLWPSATATVTLRRRADSGSTIDGRFSAAYDQWESDETLVLIADPRAAAARRDWLASQLDRPWTDRGDCRRCVRPSGLPDTNVVELMAAGPVLRVTLDELPPSTRVAMPATDVSATVRLLGQADMIPSPAQASLAEAPGAPAVWSLGEGGASVALASGEALLRSADFGVAGRGLDFRLERITRSGVIGYSPLGASGVTSPLFAHLVENPITGVVAYHDGQGNVWRFLPQSKPCTEVAPPNGYECDGNGFFVPTGLMLRLEREREGYRLIGVDHSSLRFDRSGRLVTIADRLVREDGGSGNAIQLSYLSGRLAAVEDDYGRRYRLHYEEDPNSPQYGLLVEVSDFQGGADQRMVRYEYDDQRRLVAVELPQVTVGVPSPGANVFTINPVKLSPRIEQTYAPSSSSHPFAELRLAGYSLPPFTAGGERVDRVRFTYDAATGRVSSVGLPTPLIAAASADAVRWGLAYTIREGNGLASRVDVRAPYPADAPHVTGYSLDDRNRVSSITDRAETFTAPTELGSVPSPDPSAHLALADRTTSYVYLADDRLKSVTEPDGSTETREYECETGPCADRLRKAVLKKSESTFGSGDNGGASYAGGKLAVLATSDNLPTSIQVAIGAGENDNFLASPAEATAEIQQQLPGENPDGPGLRATIQSGFPLDAVGTRTDIDAFGRPTLMLRGSLENVRSIGPTTTTAFQYGPDASGTAGAGFPVQIQTGSASSNYSTNLKYDGGSASMRGNVTGVTSSWGTGTSIEYDAWDRPIVEVSGLGVADYPEVHARRELTYDAAGHLIREVRKQKNLGDVTTIWTWNAAEQVAAVVRNQAAKGIGSFGTELAQRSDFDPATGLLAKRTTGDVETTFAYDSAGRLSSSTTGLGQAATTVRVAYDIGDRIAFRNDGDQAGWWGRFDSLGRLYAETFATGARVLRSFDQAGRLLYERTEAKVPEAPGSSNLVDVTFSETRSTYNSFGVVESGHRLIDGDESIPGNVLYSRTFYDSQGRAMSTWASDTRLASASEPSGGDPEHLRRLVKNEYEGDTGRIHATVDALENRVEYNYPVNQTAPWPLSVTTIEAGGPVTTETVGRDALGRVIKSEAADGTLTTFELDEAGNVLHREIGSSGIDKVDTEYDGAGRPRRITRPATGHTLEYGYDDAGRVTLKRVARASGLADETTFEYDSQGRMIARRRPDSLRETFEYAPDGALTRHVTRQVDASGAQLALVTSYDAANRPTFRGPDPQQQPGFVEPDGLADVDGGDGFTWDPIGRPLRSETALASAPGSAVSVTGYDLGGRPLGERIDRWDADSIRRQWDVWSQPTTTRLPRSLSALVGDGFEGYRMSFDAIGRPKSTIGVDLIGGSLPGFEASFGWKGPSRFAGVAAGGLATVLDYAEQKGRLATLTARRGADPMGSLTYGWKADEDRKLGRASNRVFAGQGWSFGEDAVRRLQAASSGAGSATGSLDAGAIGNWNFDYGTGDELQAIVDEQQGVTESFASGPEGRPTELRVGEAVEAIRYDAEHRRLEDDRSAYQWDWRGRLTEAVSVTSTATPSVIPSESEGSGRAGGGAEVDASEAESSTRVVFEHDAIGRLLSRTELGPIPSGGSDASRPFLSKRAFTWDGWRLAVETGLNHIDTPIWTKHYLPGPAGLDDAPQIRVRQSSSTESKLVTFVRDEMGTPTAAFVDEADGKGRSPRLVVRYLYSPYGSAHVEAGPEPVRLAFESETTSVKLPGGATVNQAPPQADTSIAGAIRLTTTMAIDPETLAAGISISFWDQQHFGGPDWSPISGAQLAADFAIGFDADDEGSIVILRRAGWFANARYKIEFDTDLQDEFTRALVIPSALQSPRLETIFDIPSDGNHAPIVEQKFELAYDSAAAAADTLNGLVPGGQNLLFQGAWTDPVTGLAYHRQRWYDPRTASWLSEDAYGDIDSPNLYAYVGWGPQSGTDPMGTMLAPIPLPVPPTPAPRPPHTARGPLITPRPGLGPRVGSIPAVAPTNVIEEFWATRPRGAGAFALGWKTADELTPDEQEDFLTRRMQYRSDPSIRAFVESFGRDEFEEFIIKNDIPVPMAAGGGDGDEPPGPRRPNRWDFIRKYHDDKATEVFGAGGGRRVGQRTYDKDYRGRDIEFKSDNFLRRHRSEEELARMQKQLGRDAENAASGRANPHWHFLNDPSVAPEMRPILDALANSGISWTYGNTAPVF